MAATTRIVPKIMSNSAVLVPRIVLKTFNETKELKQLDQQLPQLEQRKAALEKKLTTNGTDLSNLSVELAELIATIEAAEERWLELSELQA